MVEVLGELGPAVCPSGWGRSIPYDDFVTGFEALLTAMDVDPNGVDAAAVADHLWTTLSPLYRTEDLTDQQLDGWRRCLHRDVWFTVELLAETGLLAVDPALDREERRAGMVPVTALGRWAVRRAHGGPAQGEPALQLQIELVDSADPVIWRRVLVPAACPWWSCTPSSRLRWVGRTAICTSSPSARSGTGRPAPTWTWPRRIASALTRSQEPGPSWSTSTTSGTTGNTR